MQPKHQISVNGRFVHIIQKLLMSFSESRRAFAFSEVIEELLTVAKNQQGLCVMKKLV